MCLVLAWRRTPAAVVHGKAVQVDPGLKAFGFQLLELFESKVLSTFWFQMSTCTPTTRGVAATAEEQWNHSVKRHLRAMGRIGDDGDELAEAGGCTVLYKPFFWST